MNHRLFVISVVVAFAALAGVFLFFPRSTYSELEKRQLDSLPEFTWQKLSDNSYANELSHWFSDSEPYRDAFMSTSMSLRKMLALKRGEQTIAFHAPDAPIELPELAEDASAEEIEAHEEAIIANENAKMANNGIIILGEGENVRALMAYGGTPASADGYAQAVNKFAQEIPSVRVYSVVAPLASAFYTPEKAQSMTASQVAVLDHLKSQLSGVTYVDVYHALLPHVSEDIYLRTDHHWAPLGAYYAAQEMAKQAGVPFRDLSSYQQKVVRRFVGSMYGFSNDMAVKNAPEDFVYYVPQGVAYNTTYNNYTLNSDYKVTGEGKEYAGPFFYDYKDGSGGAYSTFLGSDAKLSKIVTSTKNGRRAMIIKDSYGNAVPGYLFYSFEEIHVVDFRYFTRNLRKYIEGNGITDVFMVCNIFNVHGLAFKRNIIKYLDQPDNHFYKASESEPLTDDILSASSDESQGDTVTEKVTKIKAEIISDSLAVESIPTAAELPTDTTRHTIITAE